jgi:hypothetical protein
LISEFLLLLLALPCPPAPPPPDPPPSPLINPSAFLKEAGNRIFTPAAHTSC